MIKKIILTPFQKFIKIESLSGVLLLATTIIALIWANSPYADSYQELWQYKVGISTPFVELQKPLILWVNDGLMAIFFFLIGLEIKREFLIGELNSMKKIAFPLVGAVGGMLVPVLFYLLLNDNPETLKGWGIPMATDIAFSLAVLNVLGSRVPLSLKIFLTAFAIVDDIGAVLVIAIFYSSDIDLTLISSALALLAALYFIAYKGYYSKYLITGIGVVIWTLFLKAGIHPTLAGILLAFSVPVRQKVDTPEFIDNLVSITDKIKDAKISEDPVLTKEQIEEIDNLEYWTDKYQSPLQRLEHDLHGWVAYFIIPIFALANAGVAFSSADGLDLSVMSNIAIALIAGNSIGIPTVVFLAKKLKFIEVPEDISIRHILGVAFLAGIGFTMSIFIASLAFKASPMFIDSAKVGILIGSFISAIIGFTILRWNSSKSEEHLA
ncbi:Na+/H+ antiporter NhaA [Lacinutrix sp. C3R15]|uniref:Na+/H+ antiporter NhaA n=1 Tax=Flavobacteriaceae TaxID=49546 RepID=UPI001C08A012|nr:MULTISPECIES: Na+/H+ antiporter NhaA [Flavobacteriaceae]MBU2940233.1 Na+/H+ antiporter NhaA [Lacinutrix sp. C3R15]MDO6623551.1 Na+/H+ antiporter NhaA [Oceanihabitans sp. 1_MG-2023]